MAAGRIKKNQVITVLYVAATLALIFLIVKGHLDQYHSREGLFLKNGEPIGGDFIAFYTGGSLLRLKAPTLLYDFQKQREFQQRLLTPDGGSLPTPPPFLPFVYPPIVALLFLPLSLLPFSLAVSAWLLGSIMLTTLSAELLLRAHAQRVSWRARMLTYLGFFAYTPLTVDCFAGGQLSVLGLFFLALAYHQLAHGKFFRVGLTLGLTYYKAPLFALFIIPLLCSMPRPFLWGLLIVGVLIGGLELSLLGLEGWTMYGAETLRYVTGAVELLNFQAPAKLGVGVYGALQRLSWLPLPSLSLIAIIWLIILFVAPPFRPLFLPLKETNPKTDRTAISAETSKNELPSYLTLFSTALIGSLALSLQVNNYDLTFLLLPLFHLLSPTVPHRKGHRLTSNLSILLILGYLSGFIGENFLLPIIFLVFTLSLLLSIRKA